MNIVIKIAVFFGLGCISILIVCLGISGNKNARARTPGSVRRHKRYARALLIITAGLIGLIEIAVRMSGGIARFDPLFVTHLVFALGFFSGILVLYFWLTGEKNARFHAPIAYTSTALFIGMASTGTALLLRH